MFNFRTSQILHITMTTRISYSFILKPELNKKGLNPVYLRAFQQGKKIEIATSVVLSKDDWSEFKQRVKKNNKSHEKYNAILEAFEKKALKYILNNFIHEEVPITLTQYGLIKRNPFKYITIKKVDGKRDFLTIEELNKLTEIYFSGKIVNAKEKEILQYFLFSCYTGLRYSDLKSLKMSSIMGNTLQINMHKTGYLVNIPLTQKATQLIPTDFRNNSSSVFRVYCNKVTNRILKAIGQQHGIQKKVTCHVARHTFATVSITLGIPIEVVSKLLGHTNLKTTQVYAKIVDRVKEREMEKWNKL